MPLISVIMPVYNTSQYLRRSIESVLNQTFKDFELICINDGSTDNSLQILEEYATTDPRIQIINQENMGQAVARNKGIEASTGEFIMFLDSDDFYHPQALEILHNTIYESKSEIAGTTKVIKLDKYDPKYFKEKYNFNNNYKTFTPPIIYILKNNFQNSVIWNKIYRRETIKNKKFIEGIYFEDWVWIICLFSEIKSYSVVDIPLYFYNNLNTSTMRSSFTEKKIKDYASGIRYAAKYYSQESKKHLWKDVKKFRIANSVKMMINKTYREKNKTKELCSTLVNEVKSLYNDKLFSFINLPIKSLIRLLKIHKRDN